MIPESGLALCRLHHWAFDEGLYASGQMQWWRCLRVVEQGENQAEAVLALRKRVLSLQSDPALAPARAALELHMQQVFRRT